MHSHAGAQKSSGAFFRGWDRERSQKRPGRVRNALRASEAVRPTDVMVNSLMFRFVLEGSGFVKIIGFRS